MKLNAPRIRELARTRGYTLGSALERARVSRTAYYSLTRRPAVLPRTILALARTLGVAPLELLTASADRAAEHASDRFREARGVCDREGGASFDNVWHTLCLLDLSPLERLNRGLLRGRATSVHR